MVAEDGTNHRHGALARPWQRWLLKFLLMLLLLYLPFLVPITAASSQYPSAAHILPFVNLPLAATTLAILGVEALSAWRLPFSWFSYVLIANISLLAIVLDSLAHILDIVQLLHLPTLNQLPQPATENTLEIGALIWAIVTLIPFAWASMRAQRRETDPPSITGR